MTQSAVPLPPPPGWGRAWLSCWPLALGAALVVTGLLGLDLEFHQPRSYESVVTVFVDPANEDPNANRAAQLHGLRRLGGHGMTITEVGEPGEIQLRLQGPESAALETRLRQVIAHHRAELESQRGHTLDHYRKDLARIDTRLANLGQMSLAGDPAVLQAAREAQEQADQRCRELEAQLSQARLAGPAEIPPLAPADLERLLRNDAQGAQWMKRRERIRADQAQVKKVAVGETRENALRELDGQLREADSVLLVVRQRLERPHAEQEAARREAERRDRITKLTTDLEAARGMAETFHKHFEAVQTLARTVDPQQATERAHLEAQRRRRVEDIRALQDGHRTPGGFEVRGEVTHPVGVLRRWVVTFSVSLLAGLFVGGLVIARQKAFGKVRSVAELTQTTGLPLLGEVPLVACQAVPIPGIRPEGTVGKEVARLEEAADRIRGPILKQLPAGPVRLLVTSPGVGDGRTTVATQLACSLARGGKRVLLVDASLSQANLAWLFQVSPEPGLSEVLRGELDLVSVVQPTSFSRLCVLPAGHLDMQARAALAQEWAGRLFEPVLAQFDIILIDAPPLESCPEASVWASRSQAAVLVVRAHQTRLRAAYSACRHLHLLRVPILGLVLVEPETDTASPGELVG